VPSPYLEPERLMFPRKCLGTSQIEITVDTVNA
jgi:hypothetical protein